MFTESNNNTPFSKLRFDVESLVTPLGCGSGAVRAQSERLRFGMPADGLLDEALKYTPAMPRDFIDRLHELVDELAEDTAA